MYYYYYIIEPRSRPVPQRLNLFIYLFIHTHREPIPPYQVFSHPRQTSIPRPLSMVSRRPRSQLHEKRVISLADNQEKKDQKKAPHL